MTDAAKLHNQAIVIDGLQTCQWSRSIFEDMRAGGLTAVNVSSVIWENFREGIGYVSEWKRFLRENDDLIRPEIVKQGLEGGKVVAGAKILSDGAVQGWWIPKYVADANPDLKTIPDLFKHPELFPSPEDKAKGAVFNGPQGWGGTVVTAQLFKAFGGEKAGFTLVDTRVRCGVGEGYSGHDRYSRH